MNHNVMKISAITTGFIEVPGKISLNIYVQGCKMACKGCQNTELQTFSGGTPVSIEDIPNISEKFRLPTWVCWLGGDAIYQSDAFMAFNTMFKKYGYNICLYTGMQFDEITELLDDVDLVVDGPWEENNGTVSKETTNQKVYLKSGNNWKNVKFNELKQLIGGEKK